MPIFDFENQSLTKLNEGMIKFKNISKTSDTYGAITINKSEISPNDVRIINMYIINKGNESCYIGRYAMNGDIITLYVEEWNGDRKQNAKTLVAIMYIETGVG